MDAESFFTRWAKRNAEARQDAPAPPPAAETPARPPAPAPAELTLDHVAQLTPESDYAPFLARGVDENIKRSALKKLFSDPQFNVMDGLDVYIDDYNKFEPVPPEVLAALRHAEALLNPLPRLEQPLMRLIEEEPEPAAPPDRAPDDDVAPGDSIEPTSNRPADDNAI